MGQHIADLAPLPVGFIGEETAKQGRERRPWECLLKRLQSGSRGDVSQQTRLLRMEQRELRRRRHARCLCRRANERPQCIQAVREAFQRREAFHEEAKERIIFTIQILVLARSSCPLKESGVVLRVRGAGTQAEGDRDPGALEVLVLKAV